MSETVRPAVADVTAVSAPKDAGPPVQGPAPASGSAAQGPTTGTGSASPLRDLFERVKIGREFITAFAALAALFISAKSCSTAKDALTVSKQQADANRRYHQEHVKPDVHTIIRHSSSPANRDVDFSAELVVWNNGPIKAVSLTGAYRVYMVDRTNSHVFASMGVSEPLVDYSFSLPECKPPDQFVKQIASAGSSSLYVVNLTYYRETDMERYSTEDYFLFENGAFYDRDSLKRRTNYNTLMDSLMWKMKCEAQGGSHRVADPPLPGTVHVNFNVAEIPIANSPDWGPIISSKTAEVDADPQNPAVYVRRGTSYLLMHKLEESASDYERAIKLGSTDFGCYQNLAVIRATSTNAVLRDGTQAVNLAKKACELNGWKHWGCISVLAASFSEAGDFTSAVKYERQALAMPELLPLEREAEERALARMLGHQPVREGL